MEKGNIRSSSSKSSVSDSKSKQDVPNKHLRLPRVKESQSPRPDTRRKPNPQRNRELFDKRPRNKNGSMYEKHWSEVTQDFKPSSKQGYKQTNLNHLLNFTFPVDTWEGIGRRSSYNKPKHPKYNKELFLQANCQFVARNTGDYTVHQNNPDKLVEWSLIEEVRLSCHEVPSCPICLYVPTAAKITRCGHIYCWPCILHYLSLTDRSWQKCPICFDAVHKTDLKSVSLKLCKSFSVGDEITLCLMKRERGSLLSVPVSYQYPTGIMFSLDEDSVTRYQKLLLATPKEVFSIIERESKELRKAYSEEKDTPEACFIETALTMLQERENAFNQGMDLVKKENSAKLKNTNVIERKHLISTSSTDSYEEHPEIIFASNEKTKMSCFQEASIDYINKNSLRESYSGNNTKEVTFFYQAEDGQHIYLHNLNVRMLLKEFASLEFAPEQIKAKLVDIERVSMTDVLRKRLRYLQHLPLTCEFSVVELNFSQIVTKETLSQFESEILKRKQNRYKKARDERRREKMIEREENKKLGRYPKATYNLNSNDQFPIYNPDDFSELFPHKETIEKKIKSNNNDSISNDYFNSTVHGCFDANPSEKAAAAAPMTSFAQMLKVGPKNFTLVSEEMKPKKLSPTSDENQRDSDEEVDEMNHVPEYHQSFSDAIQAALSSVTLQDSPGEEKVSKKKKKGKGKKQQLLFTTSMCRNKL